MNTGDNSDRQVCEIIDAAGVEALLDDLAERMRPHIGESTALIGILRRGKPVARMLTERLARRYDLHVELGELELKRYSDSLELLHDRPRLDDETLDIEIEGRHLILVDDVLYTGETGFHAAAHLRANGASRIQTAFLCARPGRTMPLHADFIGARFDIRSDWVVHCAVPPYEDHLGIALAHHEAP